MGPYGSVGAHIKTGRSPMAQDHFKTPPDPKMAHKNPMIPAWTPNNSVFGNPGLGQLYKIFYCFTDFCSFHGPFWGQEGFENDPEPYTSYQS